MSPRCLLFAGLLCACAPSQPAATPTPSPRPFPDVSLVRPPGGTHVDADGNEIADLAAAKQTLRAKLQDGSASERDLRRLVGVCSGIGDRACRNEAYARWKLAK